MDSRDSRLVLAALQRQGGCCFNCGHKISDPALALLVQRLTSEPGPLRKVAESVAVHAGCR